MLSILRGLASTVLFAALPFDAEGADGVSTRSFSYETARGPRGTRVDEWFSDSSNPRSVHEWRRKHDVVSLEAQQYVETHDKHSVKSENKRNGDLLDSL